MGKIYRGSRTHGGSVQVFVVSGRIETTLPLRYGPEPNGVRHSPTGFEVGYQGSGPAQLAFALAYDVLQNGEQAQRVYQSFKRAVIAALPSEKRWEFTESDLRDILADLVAAHEREAV